MFDLTVTDKKETSRRIVKLAIMSQITDHFHNMITKINLNCFTSLVQFCPYIDIEIRAICPLTCELLQLSMNESAKGLRPTSKASEFVKAHGTSGVEHVAFYTDDIVATVSLPK